MDFSNMAVAPTNQTSTDMSFLFADDMDAILATTSAEAGDYWVERATITQASAMAALSKDLNKPPMFDTADVRVLVTSTYQQFPYGKTTGPKDTKAIFQVAHVLRVPEGAPDDQVGPLKELTLTANPWIAFKKADCGEGQPMAKCQHVLSLLDKHKEMVEKNKGDLQEIDPILVKADMSQEVREACLPACKLANVPRWGPNHPSKTTAKDAAKKSDDGIFYVEPLEPELLSSEVDKYLKERVVADLVVTLIYAFHVPMAIKITPKTPIKLKWNKSQGDLRRFGVVDLFQFKYGAIVKPDVPTYAFSEPVAPGEIPGDRPRATKLMQKPTEMHTIQNYYNYKNHTIVKEFGDLLMKSFIISRGVFEKRLPTFNALVQQAKAASLNPEAGDDADLPVTLRFYPMQVFARFLALSAYQTLGFDLVPGGAFNDTGAFVFEKKDGSKTIVLRLIARGLLWDKPFRCDDKKTFPKRVQLASRAIYVKVSAWSEIGKPAGLLAEDIEAWQTFVPHILRCSEIILQGNLDKKNYATLSANRLDLPVSLSKQEASRFVARTREPSSDGSVILQCKNDSDEEIANGLFTDGYGEEPLLHAIDVKQVLYDFADTLRRGAIFVSKDAAKFIYDKYIAPQAIAYKGGDCVDEDIFFLSGKPAAKGVNPVESYTEEKFAFCFFSSKMSIKDLNDASKAKKEDVSRLFTPEYVKFNDTVKGNEWLTTNHLAHLINYECLTASNIKVARYLLYCIRVGTVDTKTKIQEEIRELEESLNPMATAAAKQALPPPPLITAATHDPMVVDEAHNGTHSTGKGVARVTELDDDGGEEEGEEEDEENPKKRPHDSVEANAGEDDDDDDEGESSPKRRKTAEDEVVEASQFY